MCIQNTNQKKMINLLPHGSTTRASKSGTRLEKESWEILWNFEILYEVFFSVARKFVVLHFMIRLSEIWILFKKKTLKII